MRIRRVVSHGGGVALVAFLLLPSRAIGQPFDASIDVVAVGRIPGFVLLATPTDRAEWRVRPIRIPGNASTASDAMLAPTGTKLAVAIDGGLLVSDLTAKFPMWKECEHLHALPNARFPLVSDKSISVGREISFEGCAGGGLAPPTRPTDDFSPGTRPRTARANAAKDVLYWTVQNRLYELRDGKEIPVRSEVSGDILDLIPAPAARDGALAFALVAFVDGRAAAYGVRREATGGFAVDTRPLFDPPDTLTDVRLSAAVHMTSRNTQRPPPFVVPRAYRDASIEWTFWPLAVDQRLYAPVLQFDEAEKIRPHRIEIWDSGKVNGDLELLDWYGQLDGKVPSAYYRVTSHPGTWLIEYWTYYPIDNGHVGGHPHDTEHVFVEVDKLGGAPRAVLAAAHLPENPNNLYSSLDPDDADWPTLPLFVFVELGKHAMSPDVNRDGFFTFGRDVNGYREVAHVWGVRDYIGRTDDHLNTYRGSMMVPRRVEHRMPVAGFTDYFPAFRGQIPNCDAGSKTCAYALEQLPSRPPLTQLKADIKQAKSRGYAAHQRELAREKLLYHSDALVPERIYKNAVFPDTAIRVGAGYDWFEPLPQLSAGITIALTRPFGRRVNVPLPGRIALEVMGNPPRGTRNVSVRYREPSGAFVERIQTRRFGASLQFGARYERMTSNMFGYFFGIHRQLQSQTVLPGSVGEQEVPIRQLFYRIGPMFEFRRYSVQVGPVWNWDHLRFEARASYAFKAWKGRSRFGIRE